MKLTYDQLCEEILKHADQTPLDKWQPLFEQIVHNSGWTREEFETEVISRVNNGHSRG